MTAFLVLVVLEAAYMVILVCTVDWVFAGGIARVLVKLVGLWVAQRIVLWTAAMFSGVEPGGGAASPPARERDRRNFKDLTPPYTTSTPAFRAALASAASPVASAAPRRIASSR